jgi:hypothetical protein
MHDCVERLLDNIEEDTIECLCTLMATIGQLLDRKEARHYMDYYFDEMKRTANEIGSNPAQFPWGVRFKVMILDTIDLRKNRYVLPFVLVLCLSTFCRCCAFVPVPCITHHTHTPKKKTHTQHTHAIQRAYSVFKKSRAIQDVFDACREGPLLLTCFSCARFYLSISRTRSRERSFVLHLQAVSFSSLHLRPLRTTPLSVHSF